MARTAARPQPSRTEHLQPWLAHCTACNQRLWADYKNRRTVATLTGLLRLTLDIRRCHNADCPRHRKPYRPEAEGYYALPQHEFGLDVIAHVGNLRYGEHRSVPEIHQALRRRGLDIAERTVTNLLDRYEVLLAKSLLSARQQDLADLIGQVREGLTVPIAGVISDGQHAIRKAVAQALPGVPHQLCHFHYLREAARPLYEADRHAKKELKKCVRGVRPIERSLEGRSDAEAEAARGYCDAVRSALTDDGRPPLEASGLRLHERLSAVAASLDRVAEKGGCRKSSSG